METVKRIYGPEIFFNFMEIDVNDLGGFGSVIRKVKDREIDGFVIRNVFSPDEIAGIKAALSQVPDGDFLHTPSSKLLPAPFAIMSDSGERLDTYFDKLNLLHKHSEEKPVIKNILDKLNRFFHAAAPDFRVKIPVNKVKKATVAPGNFRFFTPNKGAVHVHCGNFFQQQSLHYYSLIEDDIDMDDQLSYFVMIQQPDEGGELTIYDMLWDNVKRKESPENNEFVIDDNDRPIYLTDVRQFKVDPAPGDVVIFAGGPIWHRVEDPKGALPRITLGGFINFSNDGNEVFYWG